MKTEKRKGSVLMGEVLKFRRQPVHYYQMEECVSCGKGSRNNSREIIIQDEEGDLKHIALCFRCSEMLEKEGE